MDEYQQLFINSRKKQNNYINRAISPSPKKSAKTLSIEEEHLLKTAIEEYDDLFPKILLISQQNFISTLEKYITISSQAKSIDINQQSLIKIIAIINEKYYRPEYIKLQTLIQGKTQEQLLRHRSVFLRQPGGILCQDPEALQAK